MENQLIQNIINIFNTSITYKAKKNKGTQDTKEDGKIRIGLIKDYSLLYELNDELGKYYVDNVNLIKNLTRKRNNSILAHGLDSQSKEDFDEFLEIVLDLARKIDKHMNRFLNETKFAKFDIRLNINR